MADNEPVRRLSGLLGIDTTDLRAALSAANRELRVIDSEFKAGAASIGDWAQDATGLEMRVGSLTRTIEIQQAKVEALRAEHQRVAEQEGVNSRAAQLLEIQVNKEVEALNKNTRELADDQDALAKMGQESGDAGKKVKDLGEKEEDAAAKGNKLQGAMRGLGTVLKTTVGIVAGLTLAVAGLVGGIAGLVMGAADTAGQLVDMSAKTGISVQALQEMQYVGDQIGVSLDTMTGSMSKMTRAMAMARSGTGEQAAAFAALGVSVTDANGNLRDSQDVFAEVIDKLVGVSNETERDALSMAIFGESAQALNPLIAAGSGEIARLTDEAHKMGAVMDDEAVAALESFGDEVASLQAGLKGTLGTLAVAFLPFFQGLVGNAKTYLSQFSEIVRGANGDLGQMATGVGQLLGQIITDIAAQAPQLMAAGLQILQGIGSAILNALPTLIPAVVQMIQSIVGFLVQALPLLMEAGVQILLALINGIIPQLPMLVETALQMIITLVEGLAAALPQLIPVIADIIPRIILILIENLPLLIDAALKLILALAQGLISALPILIPYIPRIITAIFDAIIAALPMIAKAAGQLIGELATGLIVAIPQLLVAVVKVGVAIIDGLAGVAKMLIDSGGALVEGLWQGIQDRYEWIKQNFTTWLANLLKSIIDFLGIHSPSQVTAEFGRNLADGFGLGFQRRWSNVARGINASLGDLGFNGPDFPFAPAGAGAGGGAGGPVIGTIEFNIEVKEISNDADIDRLSDRLVTKVVDTLGRRIRR